MLLLDLLLAGQDRLLTTVEVAQRLRVDDTTVRRWIQQGALPAICLPEQHLNNRERQWYRVRQSVVQALLSNRRT